MDVDRNTKSRNRQIKRAVRSQCDWPGEAAFLTGFFEPFVGFGFIPVGSVIQNWPPVAIGLVIVALVVLPIVVAYMVGRGMAYECSGRHADTYRHAASPVSRVDGLYLLRVDYDFSALYAGVARRGPEAAERRLLELCQEGTLLYLECRRQATPRGKASERSWNVGTRSPRSSQTLCATWPASRGNIVRRSSQATRSQRGTGARRPILTRQR